MDLKAVRNAITLDTSNGIVEGFVNKLKAVKRVMFGRASLDLLKRKMVLQRPMLQLNCGRTQKVVTIRGTKSIVNNGRKNAKTVALE